MLGKKPLLIPSLIAAGILLASIAVPAAVRAQQGHSGFKFEYVKSGGIAGINEKIAFESKTSYDSKTNVIKFIKDASVVERQLSGATVESIKKAISDNRFFGMQGFYPPRDGVADFFSYSLTVTLDGRTHTVSWVDEWASSVPLPEGLGKIVSSIEQAYASASEPGLDTGKRRVTETIVKQSTSHNAGGHASHQAAYLLLAQQGHVYNGVVTFTTTMPVDILVYHDVTGHDETKGVHVVNGKSYAVTTLLKNVTSGSVNFVGSGILAHTTASDPFMMVATFDVLRKPVTNAAVAKSFTIDVDGERFVVRATNSQTIQQLTDNYNGRNSMHVTGKLVRGDTGFNQPWSWHFDPASVRMAEVSIEVCDGRPSYVEENLGEWLSTVGSYCPWGSKVVAIS